MIITFDYCHFDILETVWVNWNTNLIRNIVIYKGTNDYSTSSNDEIKPLFNYTFEGMRRGCDCLLLQNNYNNQYEWEGKIEEGDCSSQQILLGCTQVYEMGKEYYSKINDIGIDVIRDINMNYYEKYTTQIQSQCPNDNNNKNCGYIDSINNVLCIPLDEECPTIIINDKLSYDKSNDANKEEEALYSLINEIKDKPFSYITFKLSNDQICIHEIESPLNGNITFPLLINQANHDFYPQIENYNSPNCFTSLLDNQTIDTRYEKLFTIQFISIISQKLQSHLKQIPSFPYTDYINTKLNIWSMGYIGWSKSCANHMPKIKPLTEIKHHLKGFFTLYLVNGLIILPYFLLFIMIIAQIDYSNLKLHLSLFFSHFVLIIIFDSMIYLDYQAIDTIKEVIDDIARKMCSDDETNKLFYNLLKDIKEIEEIIRFILLWVGLMGFGSLIKICLVISKKNKRKVMNAMMNSNNSTLLTRVEIEMIAI